MQRAVVRRQHFLEQFQRFDVEIVGRLVHHEQVRRPREQFREQQPVALAAGKRGDRRARALGRKQEILQIAERVLARAADLDVLGALGYVVERTQILAQLRAMLIEIRDLEASCRASLRRDCGAISPSRSLRSVVLPEPFAPMRPTRSPRRIVVVNPSTITRSP